MTLLDGLRGDPDDQGPDRCEQCGEQATTVQVQRVLGPVDICEACRGVEAEVPEAPIAAAWSLEDEGVAVERVWPVTVNLHRYHIERVLETGVEVPAKLRARLEAGREDV